MNIINNEKVYSIYEIIIDQLIQLFVMVVIALSEFTYNRYYKTVPNTAHTELTNACQPL